MENKKYNGWSNKATWMVMHNILANMKFSEPVIPEYLKEIVDETLFSDIHYNEGYYKIVEYAKSFLNDADYNELAEAINSELTIAN